MLTFGSLFAGIGGFDLGFERAGWECRWQVEIDDYATKVLEKHWPHVRRWRDVRTFPPRSVECSYSWRGMPQGPFAPDVVRETTREEWEVDCICGGFPCQDISNAGKCAGIEGERSGLWTEYARVIRALRPRFVVVENVAALLVRGMDRVLGDLAEAGFDAEWFCLPAAAVGARHLRDRVFVVASAVEVHDAGCGEERPAFRGIGEAQAGPNRWWTQKAGGRRFVTRGPWAVEPDVGRVAYGVSAPVDRTRCLGNAVVPQVAQYIAERLKEAIES